MNNNELEDDSQGLFEKFQHTQFRADYQFSVKKMTAKITSGYKFVMLVTPETLMEMQKFAYICEKTGFVALAMDSSGAKNFCKLEAEDEKEP